VQNFDYERWVVQKATWNRVRVSQGAVAIGGPAKQMTQEENSLKMETFSVEQIGPVLSIHLVSDKLFLLPAIVLQMLQGL